MKGKIEFRGVSFKYPGTNEYVLKDFNATFEIGKKTAIVGTSGSGKSTAIQLLERFYDIESGQILIDGVNIKDYFLTHLRQAIGFLSQEPVLFDMSIEENVKYGREDITKEGLIEACGIADAMKFIMRNANEGKNDDLGNEFERRVGSKGSLLSGGQKQRLPIARAVLKKPKIILFDEATSALDSETEKIVQSALNKVSQGRTSIDRKSVV
jgi:ATP-binding cassette subfamily B (MDR/TAP) protein 1